MKPTKKSAKQLEEERRQLAAKTKREAIENTKVAQLKKKIEDNANQFCDPSKKNAKNQPAYDCKTKLKADLLKLYNNNNNRGSTLERKKEIVVQLKRVLLNLIETDITGANFKKLLDDDTVSFNNFFEALITNKYNSVSLFKDENEYANVGGSKEFKEFYKNYENPPTATAITSTADESQKNDGEQPVVAKTTDSDKEENDDRDVNSISSDPDDESIASNTNNETTLKSKTVAAPIPNRLNIELRATEEGFFVKIQTETENPLSDGAGYGDINTTTAFELINRQFADDKFKSFLTAFNGLYVNPSTPISGTDTSGIIIKIIIVNNTALKIKIDPIETPKPLNSELGFTKITQFDQSIEPPLNTIIAQIPLNFLKRFHTAYNTPPNKTPS